MKKSLPTKPRAPKKSTDELARLEEALRRSERVLFETQRIARLGSYEFDIATGTARWSEELNRLMGFSGNTCQGTMSDVLERIHPQDRDFVVQEGGRIRTTGRGEFDHRVLHPSGRPRHVRVRMETACGDDGRPVRQFGTVQDITEQRLAEQALEQSEGRFRRLAEKAPDIIYRYVLGPGAEFEYVSPAALAITGYAPEEFYADAGLWDQLVHPEDRELLKSSISAERPTTLRWVRRDGETIRVELRNVTIRDEAGQLLAVEGIARDVTERFLAERLLRETSQVLEALVQASPLGITVVDRAGHVLMWNPAAAALFGWTAEEVLARRLPVVGEDQKEAFRSLLGWEASRGVTGAGLELRGLRKDGSYVDATLWTAPLLDADGSVVATIGIFADDTDRRAAAQELLRRRELLRTLASRLSLAEEQERRRIATELHDGIGQTLAFAKMHLRGVQEASDAEESKGLAKLGELLDQAIRETRSLTAEISCSALYRFGLIPALHWLCEQVERRHGIPCTFEEGDTPGELAENLRVLIYQTVRELLANAVKHSGGTQIRAALGSEDGELHVEVADDGGGFPQAGIMDPALGSGFGLFSLQERWGEYGGKLSVKSVPGRGSQVCVAAPLPGI